MPGSLEQKLNRVWYGEQRPGLVLRGLEHCYRAGRGLAAFINRRRAPRDLQGRPIWVVGNLTAGGAGKTPLVIRLCELARMQGLKPGVVSRGYGRRGKSPMWVDGSTDPVQAGDEPVLIAGRSGAPVRVDAHRERAVRALFERGVDLVISDDGLQRAQLPRTLEICVIDGRRGFGNGHLLPAGPLREDTSRLDSVGYVVVNGEGDPGTGRAQYRMRLEPGPLQRLDGSGTTTAAELHDSGQVIHAVAGIGQPRRFFDTLKALGLDVVAHPFPDHHVYVGADFTWIGGGDSIVLTEKDAVKCRRLGLDNAWVLPVTAQLEAELETALIKELKRLSKAKELQADG